MKKKDEPNLLDLIPDRIVEWETNDEELCVIKKPKFTNKIFTKYILPRMKRPYFNVQLDEFGTCAWQSCDGSNTVEEIGKVCIRDRVVVRRVCENDLGRRIWQR